MPDNTVTSRQHPQATAAPGDDVARLWAVLSHEIRTPLMGVVGMIEVLNRTALSDEQRRIIATAEEASVALMRIVDDVLDFAKLESAQARLDAEATDPGLLVESAAGFLIALAAGKRLALTCNVPANLPMVLCDAARVRQVLLNLGANAIKYTDTGTVALSAGVLHQTDETATLRFSVVDSGDGVPESLQEFLFQPFWQVAGARESARGMGGVGLGLAICRALVDAMGGTIAIESAPGKGSRFDIDITFAKASGPAVQPQRLEGCDIVAVDTGASSLAIALEYLEAAGATVARVESLANSTTQRSGDSKPPVILVGPDAEAEDVEAMVFALERMSPGRTLPIVWLHAGVIGRVPVLPAALFPVRAYPMRRQDLFAAVMAATAGATHTPVIARAAVQSHSKGEDSLHRPGEDLVVLVAEDNRVNQEVLRQQLAILGYDCDVVGTGHAALKALEKRSYPLLLCDCHMPGMDGFELTRRIRAQAQTAQMPIVAVTANAVPGEAKRCRAAGMDDYLAKPIEIGALHAKLDQWIGPRAPQRRAPVAPVRKRGDESPVLDVSNLSVVYGHDRARIGMVLSQWAAVVSDALRDLDHGLEAEAWDFAIAAAHRLKGSAGIAGAEALSAAAAVLEVALRCADRAAAHAEAGRVRALGLRALAEVAAWHADASPVGPTEINQAALSDNATSGANK